MNLLKQLLEFCFSPVGILAWLFLMGTLTGIARRKTRLGIRLLILGGLLFAFFTMFPLAEVLIARLERDYPPLLSPDPAAGRHIVILSGYGEEKPGIPITSRLNHETICRLVEGIRLYRLLPGAKLVFAGGSLKRGDVAVSKMMAEFAGEMGVPEEDILTEVRSMNTYQNLTGIKQILGDSPFILVTSAADLRRAVGVAQKIGLNATAAPACIWSLYDFPRDMSWSAWTMKVLQGISLPSPARLRYLQWVYHEHLGYLWYWVLGRV